jgi:hypothetical protein
MRKSQKCRRVRRQCPVDEMRYKAASLEEIGELLEALQERNRDENNLLLAILWQLQRINSVLRKK